MLNQVSQTQKDEYRMIDLSGENHGHEECNAALCILWQTYIVYIKNAQLHFTEVVHQ